MSISIMRLTLGFIAVALTLLSGKAAAQQTVGELEERVALLERRVEMLERQIAHQQGSAEGIDSSRAKMGIASEKRNWKVLAIGMSEENVRALLGKPSRFQTLSSLTYWYYDVGTAYIEPHVSFDNHRVYGWNGP